jgi:hypothetical protein
LEVGAKKLKWRKKTGEAMAPEWTAASWERDNMFHNI